VQAYPQDNKTLPAGYLENLLRTLSPNEIKRLVYGNWEFDDDPAVLIDYRSIIDLWKNEHVIRTGSRYITSDVARYGRDSSKVCVWDGWRVIEYKTYKGLSVPEVAGKVRDAMTTYGVPASRVIVDDDGVGGGAVDLVGCIGFVNNARPIEEPQPQGGKAAPNYTNLKSQCYFKLASRINEAGIYIEPWVMTETEQEDTVEELEHVKQKSMDSDGKRAVLGKDEIKELIRRSPDNADVLMMREYFELKPAVTGSTLVSRPAPRNRSQTSQW
jgi:hypothetical protein